MPEQNDEAVFPGGDMDLTGLDRALKNLYRTRALIGTMPAAPATARARYGGFMVGLVRRALFWVWPQLDAFHSAVIEFAENEMSLMTELREHLVDIDGELAKLRDGSAAIAPRGAVPAAAADSAQLWLQLVHCQGCLESARRQLYSSLPKASDHLG
jgi:hypothetical protein